MTQRDDRHAVEHVCSQIRTAFPDVAYSGPVAAADEEFGEDYDETRAVYAALHERTWSEIPASFIRQDPDGFVHLTEEAFAVYLPAWLIEGVSDPEVGDCVV